MKKVFRYTIKILLGILLLIGLYFATAYILTLLPANRSFKQDQAGIPLYILSNGVHVDIAFPRMHSNLNWADHFDFSSFKTAEQKINYYSFGWGDKAFFLETPTWDDLKMKNVTRALMIPSKSAMRFTVYQQEPMLNDKRKKIMISKDQLLKMEKFILEQFNLVNNSAVLIDCCRAPGTDHNYYESNDSYHALRTCNNWANEVLIEGGIKTSRWAPIDDLVLYHLE